MENFLTTYRENFVYPYYVPLLLKATQPPEVTKPKGVFEPISRSEYCDCGMHSFDPVNKRVKELIKKEEALLRQFEKIRKERTRLDIEMLEHSCGSDDEKMKTLYELNYGNRGFPIVSYQAIQPQTEDNTPLPIKAIRTELGDGYRDPSAFRSSCIIRPTIGPPREIDITAEPQLKHYWTFGRTEYQDTISKMGYVNILCNQQFREPLPSSRRRANDSCL